MEISGLDFYGLKLLSLEFNWDEEFLRMLSVIPVLEYWNNKTDSKGRQRMDMDEQLFDIQSNFTFWEKTLSIGKVVPPIGHYGVKITEIFESFDMAKRRQDKIIKVLNCKEMSALENADITVYPRIRYIFRSLTVWKGSIYESKLKTTDITQRRYLNTGPDKDKTYNEKFELGKIEVINVLRTQGWKGFPKLHALCITTKDEKDVTEHYINGDKEGLEKAYFIRLTHQFNSV